MSTLARQRLLLAVCALAVVAALLAPRIAQNPLYHQFADNRGLASMPNALNILTNLLFLWVGIEGLLRLFASSSLQILRQLRPACAIFFVSLILIAIGSGYYHWAPDNSSLAWDRGAMAIAFMSFFTIVLGERVSLEWARILLPVLIAAGIASIVYWHYSELAGNGDLRPYALVQFLPLLLVPLILLLFEPRYTRDPDIWKLLLWYAAAKSCEVLDQEIYSQTLIISGHSLKHIAAGIACFVFLRYLRLRRPL